MGNVTVDDNDDDDDDDNVVDDSDPIDDDVSNGDDNGEGDEDGGDGDEKGSCSLYSTSKRGSGSHCFVLTSNISPLLGYAKRKRGGSEGKDVEEADEDGAHGTDEVAGVISLRSCSVITWRATDNNEWTYLGLVQLMPTANNLFGRFETIICITATS